MKYNCLKCGDEWHFCEEDYNSPLDYPFNCPLCSMPITQMIKEVYEIEGIKKVIKRIIIRFNFRIKHFIVRKIIDKIK